MKREFGRRKKRLQSLKREKCAPTIAEILRKYNVATSIYYKWKRQFEAYGEAAFNSK